MTNLMRTIRAVARIETQRLMRSPTSFTLLLLVPALQILLFGTAIRPGSSAIRIAVAGPSATRAAASEIFREPGMRPIGGLRRPGQAEAAARAGDAQVGVELPTSTNSADAHSRIRVLIDYTEPADVASAEARVRAAYWRETVDNSGLTNLSPQLTVERLYNPTGRADWGFLPALIGAIIMVSMLMLGTLSIAREREFGTWEVLLSLPIDPVALITGKIAPYVLIGTLQGIVVLAISVGLFDVPTRGSVGALMVLMPLFAAAHLVLGYALAARARTQLAAVQGAVAFYLPAMLLSGFLYPFDALSRWARTIGDVFPLTHFIRAAREATIRGGGVAVIALQGIPILLFLLIAASIARFQHRSRFD